MGVSKVTWPTFWNFGTPQRRWVKRLETVNIGPLMYKAMQQPLWENHFYGWSWKLQIWQVDWTLGILTRNEENAKLGQHGREHGHVTYFLKFWNTSKTVSQTIRNSKHWAPDVQSYATAIVRKPLGLFALL